MLSLLLTVIVSLLLPQWLLLVICIPLLMVLAFNNTLPPLFSIGDADIHIFDLILLIVALRVAGSVILRRHKITIYPIYSAIAFFFTTLLMTTIIAYYRFGEEVFVSEIISFLRFLMQVSVFFLLIYATKTARQLTLIQKSIEYLGYAIAATIYVNTAAPWTGIKLGEVQTTELTVRYFGPLGDQVGFILLFFIYQQLMARRFLRALFFGGALGATGTAGSLIALGVGLTALIIRIQKKDIWRIGKHVLPLLVMFFISMGLLIFANVGGLYSRITTGTLFTFNGMQRLLAASLAVQVFLDNPLTGVGYSGFRFIAPKYGAEEIFRERLLGFSPNFIATTSNQYLQVVTDGGLLALISFVWLVIVALQTLKSAMRHMAECKTVDTNGLHPKLQIFFGAGYIWLWSLIIGNQTAVWLTPASLIGYLLWIILASAVAANTLSKSSLEIQRLTLPRGYSFQHMRGEDENLLPHQYPFRWWRGVAS